MTFSEYFLRVLLRRPLAAFAALYWYATRRRVRGWNRLRVASVDLPFAYKAWISKNEESTDLKRHWEVHAKQFSVRPRFLVQIHSADGVSKTKLRASISSVENQVYPYWRLADVVGNDQIETSTADSCHYVIPLRAGDLLAEMALFRFAEALQASPVPELLYGDEDQLDILGRRAHPWFKPRWNEELFLALDYVSSGVAIDLSLADRAAAEGRRDLSSLLLQAASTASSIVHVPHVLVHVAQEATIHEGRLKKVARHVAAAGASCIPGPFGTVKVHWPLPEQLPLVSVIIPTKDKLDVLRPCVESLLTRTTYGNFEVLIVDNQSIKKETMKFFADVCNNGKVRVLQYQHHFNYSAINNYAVAQAHGSYVCLLNNDTEVLEPNWLTEMMRHAVRPNVGAVGAKLLYDDGTIQHAGVVVGIGEAAGHAHRSLPADQPGYFLMPHVTHFVSAVTGACLLVAKTKFQAVGGLDQEQLAIAFNDVDLCLKLDASGWRNVYVPHAVLLHHESKSRPSDMASSEHQRYCRELKVLQERWGTKTYQDPLHNPNLDRYNEQYVLRL